MSEKVRKSKHPNPLDIYSTQQKILYSWDVVYRETKSYATAMKFHFLANKIGENVQTVSNVIFSRRRCLRVEKKLAELFKRYTANMDKYIFDVRMRFAVSRSMPQRRHRRKLQLWINRGFTTKTNTKGGFKLKKRFVSKRKGWVQD